MLGKLDFFIIGYAAGTVATILLAVGMEWAYKRSRDAWEYGFRQFWKKKP